ncbi:hypothetical protein [Piscinibacter terrae]|uniref:Uncharacterized protein n=1 Tax=Piscinibacter terrae TaxID=2496871 RepID=A0A3N7ISH5_9BURK|nr:hypothetical protein [Albitalea terrae]RQP21802.1 hypothetical protein DZC73_25510 [Albitalea terrae]
MDDDEQKHSMTYQEREQLKQFARKGQNLEQTLIMISHWMSCGHDVTFSGYAANWAAANSRDDVGAIRQQWPLTGPRMIADDRTEWGSAVRTD